MKLISMIILCCFVSLFSCSKDSFTNEIPKEELSLKISHTASPDFGCLNQTSGFADFPFQSNQINGIEYPYCTPQLCVLIESWFFNPYFSISSADLKICNSSFATMSHPNECGDFSPTQITYLQYAGGTEIQFQFQQEFWVCFNPQLVYPGMDFQLEHEIEFL